MSARYGPIPVEGIYPVLPLSARVAPAISQLALDAFDRFIAPEYSREGREAFRRYAAPEAVRFRLESGELAFGAFDGGQLVGVLEMRGRSHIALLFVEPRHHKRGIARALLENAVAWARRRDPELRAVTLNSSPYAKGIYPRLGFYATGPENDDNGIRSTPMQLDLEPPR